MITQLLNRVDSYLLLYCTRRDLEVWLLSNLQRILDSGEKVAIDLANEIDTDLVQLGEGLIDELTFRERLQTYIRLGDTLLLDLYQTQPVDIITATASAETISGKHEITPITDLRLQHSFV